MFRLSATETQMSRNGSSPPRVLLGFSTDRVFPTMRRAQSTRNYGRPSIAPGTEDLTMLKEDLDDTDVLRRQLIEKDRENDKVSLYLEGL